jgi:hypothetical protein
MVEKQQLITGYKLKRLEYTMAIRAIWQCDSKEPIPILDTKADKRWIEMLAKAGVLFWFEPQYAPQKKTKELVIGNKGFHIQINSEREVWAVYAGISRPIDIHQLGAIYGYLSGREAVFSLGDEPVHIGINRADRGIQIGNKTCGHYFSLNEIEMVINTYNELNP